MGADYAEIDQFGKVLRILYIDDSALLDKNGEPNDEVGSNYMSSIFGGQWVRSYPTGGPTRYPAEIGGTYLFKNKIFKQPRPFPSWIFDEESLEWKAPKPYPDDDNIYGWDESKLQWSLEQKYILYDISYLNGDKYAFLS